MGRIAVVAGPDPGHAFPAVGLGCALRAAGHDVTVFTGRRWADAVGRSGLGFEPLPRLEADPRDGDFGFVLWGRGRLMAPLLAGRLRELAPHAVVADTITVAGWFAADLIGVPRVELVPHVLQLPSRALPPAGTGLAAGRTPRGRLRDAVLRSLNARSLARAAREREVSRTALGLPPDGPPALRLVATLPGLEPARPDWPPFTHVVGPFEWDPAAADLAAPPGGGPLVFLADSSATGRPQHLLDLAADGLAGTGFRVACTRFAPWEGAAPHVAAGPGRQAPLLDAAVAVVCAGGHGMVAKALSRGLPLVVVPGPGDQWENAARVSRLGAGVVLRPGELSAASLAAAVRRVAGDPAYAAAARRVRDAPPQVPTGDAVALLGTLVP